MYQFLTRIKFTPDGDRIATVMTSYLLVRYIPGIIQTGCPSHTVISITNQEKIRWRNAVQIRWVEEGARLCAIFAAEESFAGVAAELVVGDDVRTLTGFEGRHFRTAATFDHVNLESCRSSGVWNETCESLSIVAMAMLFDFQTMPLFGRTKAICGENNTFIFHCSFYIKSWLFFIYHNELWKAFVLLPRLYSSVCSMSSLKVVESISCGNNKETYTAHYTVQLDIINVLWKWSRFSGYCCIHRIFYICNTNVELHI